MHFCKPWAIKLKFPLPRRRREGTSTLPSATLTENISGTTMDTQGSRRNGLWMALCCLLLLSLAQPALAATSQHCYNISDRDNRAMCLAKVKKDRTYRLSAAGPARYCYQTTSKEKKAICFANL